MVYRLDGFSRSYFPKVTKSEPGRDIFSRNTTSQVIAVIERIALTHLLKIARNALVGNIELTRNTPFAFL